MRRKIITATKATIAISLLSIASTSWAGDRVQGFGSSRGEAAANANENARIESQNRWGKRNCITPVRESDCRQDSGGWVCDAHVDNEAGSCS
jgi:hypothetical protein